MSTKTPRDRWYEIRAEREKLRLAQDRRELAPTGLVAVAFGGVAAAVRQAVFSQAAAVAPKCVGRSAPEIHAIFYEGLRQAFELFDGDHIERIIIEACEAEAGKPKRQKR
jgi:hypothetical protein